MGKFFQTLSSSFVSTSSHKRWWILALVQAICLSLAFASVIRPRLLFSPFLLLVLAAIILFTPITVWLWLDIDARKSQSFRQKDLKVFARICIRTFVLACMSFGIIFLARIGFSDHVFFTIVSSVVAATAVLAMLFVVLCGQNFKSSLALALDTWSKKVSLAAIMSFILIVSQAFAFAVINGIWKGSKMAEGFEVLSRSATIWLLFLVLAIATAFLTAFVNCLLVHLFLDTIRFKKDQEAKEETVAKQIVLEAP